MNELKPGDEIQVRFEFENICANTVRMATLYCDLLL